MKTNLQLALLLLVLAGCDQDRLKPQSAATPRPPVRAESRPPVDTNRIGHFWFAYPYQPQPGSRIWISLGQTNWIEVYPDGSQSRYQLIGREVVHGIPGVVVSKTAGDVQVTETLNDGSFQAFLPDRNSPNRVLHFRKAFNGQWQPWQALAEVSPIE